MLSLRATSKSNVTKKAGGEVYYLINTSSYKFKNNTKQNLCCMEEKNSACYHMKPWISFQHINWILWTEMYMNMYKSEGFDIQTFRKKLNLSSVNRFIVSQMAAQEGKWVLQTHHPPVGEGREQTLRPVLTLPPRIPDRIASSHNFLLMLLPGQHAIMYCNWLRAGWVHN